MKSLFQTSTISVHDIVHISKRISESGGGGGHIDFFFKFVFVNTPILFLRDLVLVTGNNIEIEKEGTLSFLIIGINKNL